MPSQNKTIHNRSIQAFLLLLFLAIGFGLGHWHAHNRLPPSVAFLDDPKTQIMVRFSPRGGCTQLILEAIERAQTRIYVYAYAFTSAPIADALIAAQRRGVQVCILVDRRQSKGRGCQIPRLHAHGIPIWLEKVSGLSHNKVMILDHTHLLTGSFNWSAAAEYRNGENLLYIKSKTLNRHYRIDWHQRMKKSPSYGALGSV